MRRIVRALCVSVIVAFVFLAIADRLSNDPNVEGFPFSYVYWLPGCAAPGFACRAFNPLYVGVDYLFWLVIAFALVFGVSEALQRLAR